jgi:Leucine-rich repeat (LRR) protein
LKELKELDLQSNFLSEVPTQLIHLEKLKVLYLQDNAINNEEGLNYLKYFLDAKGCYVRIEQE